MGSAAPEGRGLFFSWGNIEGHREGSGYDFSQSVYNTTPAASIVGDLNLSQDAARSYWGYPWRMPSSAEFQELFDNCANVWTSVNGVNGRLFTSNINGETIFFPAAGDYAGTSLTLLGRYWSSSYDNETNAKCLALQETFINPTYSSERRYGFTIRPIRDP